MADADTVRVTFTPDGRASRQGAAAYLGLKAKTLSEWCRIGKGPIPRKVGGRVFYRRADLDAFVTTGAREATT